MNILASLNSERETERKGQPAGVRYGAVHLIMSKGPVKLWRHSTAKVLDMERKRADTTDTVLVSWAGHFQC